MSVDLWRHLRSWRPRIPVTRKAYCLDILSPYRLENRNGLVKGADLELYVRSRHPALNTIRSVTGYLIEDIERVDNHLNGSLSINRETPLSAQFIATMKDLAMNHDDQRHGEGCNRYPVSMSTVLEIGHEIGCRHLEENQLRKAAEWHHIVLIGKYKELGPHHESTLHTLSNLGVIYRRMGRLDEAATVYHLALKWKMKLLGPNSRSTLDTLSQIAIFYHTLGRIRKAKRMYKQVLKRYRDLRLDPVAPLNIVFNLASLYEKEGNLLKAQRLYEEALDGFQCFLGLADYKSLLVKHRLENLKKFIASMRVCDYPGANMKSALKHASECVTQEFQLKFLRIRRSDD